MSFVINPPEGGELGNPDYVTYSRDLLPIVKTLNDIFGKLEGEPYYSILIEISSEESDNRYLEHWIKSLVRQYENIDLYELDGLTLFSIPGDAENQQYLRLFIIKKRKNDLV
jgi:hypothetical protein